MVLPVHIKGKYSKKKKGGQCTVSMNMGFGINLFLKVFYSYFE